MGRKKDLKQVDDVAAEFGMDEAERMEFGEFIEESKARGDRGTKNDRGDYTWGELYQKAKEFLGLPDED